MSAQTDTHKSSKASDKLAEQIRALSAEFADTLKGSVDDIRHTWTTLPRDEGSDASAPGIAHIQNIAHSLAGTGKSLGFPRISQSAAPIDGLFRLLQENKTPLTAEEIDQIDLLISDLERAVDVPGEPVVLGDLHAQHDPNARPGTFHILQYGDLGDGVEALSSLSTFGYNLIRIQDTAPPNAVISGDPTALVAAVKCVS
jgi:HPt (histidine-containing phosphotransfer) domain-containing protein